MFRKLFFVAIVLSVAAFAQQDPEDAYQIRYASNLNIGESVINITNSGARGADLQSGTSASITGSICVNVYAFDYEEQLVSCCSCPVTPNGLKSLSVQRDLINNTLTRTVPLSVVIKLVATVPTTSGSCYNSAADITLPLAPGMVAWGTTLHALPSGGYAVTETPFIKSNISSPNFVGIGERSRITQLCNFILANGSGWGVCNTCRFGGLPPILNSM